MSDVSVVVPTRNRRRLLLRAVASVLAQTASELEVLVLDDGSTDGSADALLELGDPRVRVLRNASPRGVSAARNGGISASTGTWVAFLDDDDVWAPDKLALQLAELRSTGMEWACAGTVMVDTALRILRGGPPPSADEIVAAEHYRNVVPGGASGVMARRRALEELGGFDEGLRHLADWDMWIRLVARGKPAVAARPVIGYVLHAGNASLDNDDVFAELDVIERRYAAARSGEPVDRAFVYRWAASSALRAGRRGRAARTYWKAVRAGDARSLLGAVAAPVYPRRRLLAPRLADERWAAEAERWLDPLRRLAIP